PTILLQALHRSQIASARQSGWRVELIYLALPSIEMSKLRVAERVAHGGHNIPQAAIERRFARSLRNLLDEFSYVCDCTQCYVNDSDPPRLVFTQAGQHRTIIDATLFDQLNS
ncbi:MAG: hypothetical protein AAFX40_14740, partial [Cyanobacteria bacterium J06639_1]